MKPRPCVCLAALASASLSLAGCAILEGKGPPLRYRVAPDTPAPVDRDGPWAGAARVDLTPPPGYSTFGYGPGARITRGVWTRLRARAVYLENDGVRFVMVACDLNAVGGSLVDRVMELVADATLYPPGIAPLGRDEIVVTATHTHHGPGNFASGATYNLAGGRTPGFDPHLHEFLAQQIARAIVRAQRSAKRAQLRHWSRDVAGVVRNRALDSFVRNAESRAIIRGNAALPPGPGLGGLFPPAAYRAVRPRLFVLEARAAGDPDNMIARAAVFASHPTVLDSDTGVYSADLFGVAAHHAESRLRRDGAGSPVVAIFNGAEGDVHPGFAVRDRHEVLKLGRRLGREIVDDQGATPIPQPAVAWRAGDVRIADTCLDKRLSERDATDAFERCTASRPLQGVAGLGGAFDGYSFLRDLGFKDGVVGNRRNKRQWRGQGIKEPALDSFLGPGVTKLLQGKRDAPRSAAVGIYRIGPLAFATAPAEMTTTMGLRIEAAVAAELRSQGVRQVVLLGLANEYISYMTTPEEYEAQAYEGASNLYGPLSGPVVQKHLAEMAAGMTTTRPTRLAREHTYLVGKRASFTPAQTGEPPLFPDDGLGHIAQDPLTRRTERRLPTACWSDPMPGLRDLPLPADLSVDLAPRYPTVRVRTRRPGAAWRRFDDRTGTHLLLVGTQRFATVEGSAHPEGIWCAVFIPRRHPGWRSLQVVFDVDRLDGTSDSFPARYGKRMEDPSHPGVRR